MSMAMRGKTHKVDPSSLPLLICLIPVALCAFEFTLPVGMLEPSPTSNCGQ